MSPVRSKGQQVYGVWFGQENYIAYAVKATNREAAIRKATRIWKQEHREPSLQAVENLPPWGFGDAPKEQA